MIDKTGITSAKKLHKCNGRSSWVLKFPLYSFIKVPRIIAKQIEKANTLPIIDCIFFVCFLAIIIKIKPKKTQKSATNKCCVEKGVKLLFSFKKKSMRVNLNIILVTTVQLYV